MTALKAAFIDFCAHLGAVAQSANTTSDILLPYKVVVANVLADSCQLPHPTDTEQHDHPIGVSTITCGVPQGSVLCPLNFK